MFSSFAWRANRVGTGPFGLPSGPRGFAAATAAAVSSLGASSSSTSSSIQNGIVRPVGVPVRHDWRARCPALPWD